MQNASEPLPVYSCEYSCAALGCYLQFLNHEKCRGIEWTIIKIGIVMPRGYSRKFSRDPCKIQLSRDNLGEQKVLEGAFSEFSESLQPKIFTSLTTMVPSLGYTGFITKCCSITKITLN